MPITADDVRFAEEEWNEAVEAIKRGPGDAPAFQRLVDAGDLWRAVAARWKIQEAARILGGTIGATKALAKTGNDGAAKQPGLSGGNGGATGSG